MVVARLSVSCRWCFAFCVRCIDAPHSCELWFAVYKAFPLCSVGEHFEGSLLWRKWRTLLRSIKKKQWTYFQRALAEISINMDIILDLSKIKQKQWIRIYLGEIKLQLLHTRNIFFLNTCTTLFLEPCLRRIYPYFILQIQTVFHSSSGKTKTLPWAHQSCSSAPRPHVCLLGGFTAGGSPAPGTSWTFILPVV